MGGQGAILDAALSYSTAVFGGAVSICMLNILANVVRGTGNMIYPAMVLVGSVLAHVVISPLLIFGCGPVPALGPAGAGWGLALSFGIGSAVLFFHLRGGQSPVKLDFSRLPRQWALYKEFFKVGIPGLLNVALNNLAVIVLTGVAGHLGREAAIGYAMGARLEYIMIPLAFGFGTAMVTMVGTNWGAKQRQRARAIAWTGAGTVAAACGIVGVFFALFPSVWIGIFTDEDEVLRVGTLYLQTVGPMYALCGAGMAIYFAMQGTGNPMPAVLANAFRVAVSAGGALVAVSWLGAGPLGLFIAIGSGFLVYGGLNAYLLARR